MSREALRSVLDIVEDPHAFATAYINHTVTVGRDNALPLPTAAYRFETTGRI